jgi:hypothetical protein
MAKSKNRVFLPFVSENSMGELQRSERVCHGWQTLVIQAQQDCVARDGIFQSFQSKTNYSLFDISGRRMDNFREALKNIPQPPRRQGHQEKRLEL